MDSRNNRLALPRTKTLWPLFLVVLWNVGCSPSDASLSDKSLPSSETQARGPLSFELVAAPAGAGSSTPSLHTTVENEVLLSWVEPRMDGGHALRFSRLRNDKWSTPKTITEGENWFVNWADFPSLISLGGDKLAAHFLARSAESTYAYDVFVIQSADAGETWSSPARPHTDGTKTEHGFVSMLADANGTLFATWLDGRNTAGHGHEDPESSSAMTLRAATISHDGLPSEEALLDNRTCDCCQTSAARTKNGLIVAYRDRSDEEIRDIYVVRMAGGAWSEPQAIHHDGWQINGCPVNGPATAASGEQVAIAWFTAADSTPQVRLSFSLDEGRSFSPPVQVDDGRPLGRVHALLLPDSSAVVSWIERVGSGAEIRVRRIQPDGATEESSTVAAVSGSRANGFPRMTLDDDRLYVAWTETGDPSHPSRENDATNIRTAVAILDYLD